MHGLSCLCYYHSFHTNDSGSCVREAILVGIWGAFSIIEKVINDGSIGSIFNEGMMKVEGETAYCVDINTNFKNGYKTRADASICISAEQIADVALSLEYVKYSETHKELNYQQVYLLEQCIVLQALSVHLGW